MSSMKGYIVKNVATGRYYTTSKAKCVDEYDVNYAKVFPTEKSASLALPWYNQLWLDTSSPDPSLWVKEPLDVRVIPVSIEVKEL